MFYCILTATCIYIISSCRSVVKMTNDEDDDEYIRKASYSLDL